MTADALTLSTFSLPEAARAHWRGALVALAMLALFATTLAGIALRDPAADAIFARQAAETAQVSQLRRQAIEMSATQIRPVAPTDALAINAAIPIADVANPAARPFRLMGSEAERARALDCLTAAIYYEAATEPTDGQRAVAQVVLNRVRHPAYPPSVCGVVFEGARRTTGCQFSFSCDGSLRRAPMAPFWQRARAVAEAALAGYVHAPAGWATHYHANYVVPYWASSLVKTATVGAHIFYRWRGGWGRPTAFLNRYAGAEPAIAWRGGFGQPTAQERMLAAAEANARDALAAAAAEGAAPLHSVDSFSRAVLRRYEPLRRDTANAIIAERTRADSTMTNSQRWALTGSDDEAETPQQRPLGRWAPPTETQTPPPAAPPPPASTTSAAGGAAPSPMNP